MPKKKVTLNSVYELLQTIAVRLISVEETVKEHIQLLVSLRDRLETLHGAIEKLEVRFGRLEQEYTMIKAALKRLEEKFDRFEAQRLNERITSLENRVAALESIQ